MTPGSAAAEVRAAVEVRLAVEVRVLERAVFPFRPCPSPRAPAEVRGTGKRARAAGLPLAEEGASSP